MWTPSKLADSDNSANSIDLTLELEDLKEPEVRPGYSLEITIIIQPS
jgi:hypothetical protein